MRKKLRLEILPQPDDTNCGPTCLQAIYNYYGEDIPLQEVIDGVPKLEGGGTLAVMLAQHALRQGYRATIYTYNLHLFDPTWFESDSTDLSAKLRAQADARHERKLRGATKAYLEYLELGGRILFTDLTPSLLCNYLELSIPILTGLSATYLYNESREIGETNESDDIRGEPVGHFVVLSGFDKERDTIHVADPLHKNARYRSRYYDVSVARVISSILLGIVTYDANLLIIEPE
jgi:hypothetical protein